MDKILYHSVTLNCDTQRAFEMFTVNEHLQKWLTGIADVEPRIGGKYELFWNPKDRENDSTKDCKITAIEPGKFLAFEWKGPKQYKHFMNSADPLTHVVAFFMPGEDGTEVHLMHSGWGSSSEWEEARAWFKQAWASAFERLREYVHGLPSTTKGANHGMDSCCQ